MGILFGLLEDGDLKTSLLSPEDHKTMTLAVPVPFPTAKEQLKEEVACFLGWSW
jgi:hypothetical protein